MSTRKSTTTLFALAVLIVSAPTSSTAADGKPLKVYILAGQSNMEGHAKTETLAYLADDPATAPMLDAMQGPGGNPRVCDNVWISYLTGSGDAMGEGTGKLTAGYGSRSNPAEDGGKIGPEFGFGVTMEKANDGPVLIIKTAWGGKSLHTDFRSPGGGPYELNSIQREQAVKKGRDIAEFEAEKAEATGKYYRFMVDHIAMVLNDIKRVCPVYDPEIGYELAGFVWFQGWNDMVDGGTYPERGKPGGYDLYSRLLAHFIRDVRKDLGAPEMPFVIGVMGVGGPIGHPEAEKRYAPQWGSFRSAMAAPAAMPEFAGNVVAVETAPYWDFALAAIERKRGQVQQMGHSLRTEHKEYANKDGSMSEEAQQEYLDKFRAELISPGEEALWERGASNAGYHYLGSAKTMVLIGNAFAEAILQMEHAE